MRVILFLGSFFAIYGGFHLYFYLHLKKALPKRAPKGLIGLALLFFCFSPVLVRLVESKGFLSVATIGAHISYWWMAFVLVFLPSMLTVQSLAKIFSRKKRFRFKEPSSDSSAPFFLGLFISILALGYGFFEAGDLRVERVEIPSQKIAASQKIRVVQISDVHLGLMSGEKETKRLVSVLEGLRPHILVSTGDFVDGHRADMLALTEQLAQITAPWGKFAIIGNHEVYVGQEYAHQVLEAAGFELLRNRAVDLAANITVAGLDDPAASQDKAQAEKAEDQLNGMLARGRFSLLLKHRPERNEELGSRFDLQLSGHTHKGQIFPYGIFPWLIFRYPQGLVRLRGGGFLYHSRGTGVWGPPIRILSPPEVTVIDLIGKGQAAE